MNTRPDVSAVFKRDITNQDRDARLELAKTMLSPDMTEEGIVALREFAGFASPLYRPGHRIWNWFFDTEYTAIMPPWLCSVPVVLLLTAGVLIVVQL